MASIPKHFDERELSFTYTNWKGETRKRHIIPVTIRLGYSEYHEGRQWFMTGIDIERDDCPVREFAMKDIEGIKCITSISTKAPESYDDPLGR